MKSADEILGGGFVITTFILRCTVLPEQMPAL